MSRFSMAGRGRRFAFELSLLSLAVLASAARSLASGESTRNPGIASVAPVESLAATCPVPLFREYDPARPPRILTDPPVRTITDSPCLDPDPAPPGARLVYYKVNEQDGPDPLNPAMKALKRGRSVELHWTGGGDPGPCCVAADCRLLCPRDCRLGGGVMHPGVDCAASPCQATGACCSPSSGGCVDGLTRQQCEGYCSCYGGDGTTCAAPGPACSFRAACCDPASYLCRDDFSACTGSCGVSYGCGVACDGGGCPTGACCHASGGCTEDSAHLPVPGPGRPLLPLPDLRRRWLLSASESERGPAPGAPGMPSLTRAGAPPPGLRHRRAARRLRRPRPRPRGCRSARG